ncbi:glutathione S-transferase [Schlegelella sp. S2-27]|uniref:Glutathione S-transferase n=1 Tax=Caldimonas mangrovi TaxID=2944811 RepID=A0ABT0YIA0_9BURK|nr:glutathione S-transferase [Caldimonas mangrovi]MCM5677927.1 glutathione S-transferase [Caldimonas mangrovi]
MKLLYQTHSPFARKVLVFLHEAGLAARVQVVHHETSPTRANPEVYAVNPLGKVPVLVRPEAPALFDSTVICEYADTLADEPGRLVPTAGEARWRVLRLDALAKGLCEAGIAVRWETERRPEPLRYAALRDGMAAKLVAGYDVLESEWQPQAPPVDLGSIAVATALSWIEFRGLPSFRTGRPHLTRWFDAFTQRASMRATPLSGQTHD